MTYAQIADFLRETHQVSVCRETIFKFIKVRSRLRRAYVVMREARLRKSPHVSPTAKPPQVAADPQVKPAIAAQQPSMPKFEFTYSERYNLKRLPKEEAAAIRKKLEEEGH